MTMNNCWWLKYVAVVGLLLFAFPAKADPVAVRHLQGFLHGFVVLKESSDKILASGDVTQLPGGNSVTLVLSLRF
jgi:hypothetical protein